MPCLPILFSARRSWLAVVAASAASFLAAADLETALDAVSEAQEGSSEGISQTLQIRDLLEDGPFASSSALRQWREWREESMDWLGLDALFSYDALAMGALAGGETSGGLAGDASFGLRWQLRDDDGRFPLALSARLRHRHGPDGSTPADLRADTGAIWGYVDGFNNAGFEVPELYLEQKFLRNRLLVRLGQMAIDDLLDDHRMRSAKRSFLNQAFSSSPAVGFPGSGLGLVARWKGDHGWDATFAASNIQSSNLNDEVDWSFSSALFEALQVGWRFNGIGGLPARVQVVGWNADALEDFAIPSGRGLSLTLEQQWPERLRSYLRIAWADGEASPADQLIALGLSRAMGAEGIHRLGIAAAAGRSSTDSSRWQGVLELFYRHHWGPFHLTPDIQFSVGDGIGGGRDWIALCGLRIGATF